VKRALVVLAACASRPVAPLAANVARPTAPLGPHASQDGLRGFEDGQPITLDALASWVPGARVIEHVPGYFVFVAPGVELSRDELDSVDPARAIAVLDDRSDYDPSLAVMARDVTNPWGVEPGMSIGEVKRRLPSLRCDERGPPLCVLPHSRIHFVVEASVLGELHVVRWLWHGSGRTRAAYRAPVADWRFEAGGIGPIDGMTPATADALAALAPGLSIAPVPDGFVVSRAGVLAVHLHVFHDGFSTMDLTTPVTATRSGLHVGDSLRALHARLPGATCGLHAEDGGIATIQCDDRGVRYWAGSHPMTARDRALVDAEAPFDEAVTAGLLIDRIETEVY